MTVFCSNFFVFHSILMFLVWKNHGRCQRLFEAKNTQKLRRVRKLWGKNKMKKTKKQKKRGCFFVFLLITLLFFHRFQLSLLQKVAGVHSHRPSKGRLETPKGLGVIRKNKMKKETKRFLFSFCFFAVTFLSFIRFPCSWSLKITRVASDFSRPRTRRNSKGFGS